MSGLDPLVIAFLAFPIGMVSLEIFRASRSSRRNGKERCGACGGPLYAAGVFAGPSLVQGYLICEPCAAKERINLKRGLLVAAGFTATTILVLASVALFAPAQLGAHPWIAVAAAAGEYMAIFGGALAWMKWANRRAAQRLGLQLHFHWPLQKPQLSRRFQQWFRNSRQHTAA